MTNALSEEDLMDAADYRREAEQDAAAEALDAALAELEETGVALRAERDRIAAELWRWRFTWFWSAVETFCRLDQAGTLLNRAFVRAYDGGVVREIITSVENVLSDEV